MKKVNNKQIRLRQKHIIRETRRRKAYVKLRNTTPKVFHDNTPKSTYRRSRTWEIVEVPPLFSFETNREGVLKFINLTYKKYKSYGYAHIFFDMGGVVALDMVAICLMLSLLNKLSWRNITYAGSYPDNEEVREYMTRSGFLNAMKTQGIKLKPSSYPNQMYMIGQNNLQPQLIGESVKHAMNYVIGEKTHFKPLYSILVEICGNSVEHANDATNEKNWLVSISYDNGQANFIVTDSGQGILKTLHKKASELFTDIITFKSQANVLKDVFGKKYQSKTEEINRHKGLPNIKLAYERGIIRNLEVLTNNVYYNFDRDESCVITNEFRGTLFKWSIDRNNYELWKKRIS